MAVLSRCRSCPRRRSVSYPDGLYAQPHLHLSPFLREPPDEPRILRYFPFHIHSVFLSVSLPCARFCHRMLFNFLLIRTVRSKRAGSAEMRRTNGSRASSKRSSRAITSHLDAHHVVAAQRQRTGLSCRRPGRRSHPPTASTEPPPRRRKYLRLSSDTQAYPAFQLYHHAPRCHPSWSTASIISLMACILQLSLTCCGSACPRTRAVRTRFPSMVHAATS